MGAETIVKILFEVISRGVKLYNEVQSNTIDYKGLTPEQIEELLMPKGWVASEIRKAADAKAGL
jgi:hypothetical protein